MEFKPISAPDCPLGENPIWYAPTSESLWTDMLRGVIYAYDLIAACQHDSGNYFHTDNLLLGITHVKFYGRPDYLA